MQQGNDRDGSQGATRRRTVPRLLAREPSHGGPLVGAPAPEPTVPVAAQATASAEACALLDGLQWGHAVGAASW